MARIAFCKDEMLCLQVGPIKNLSCFQYLCNHVLFDFKGKWSPINLFIHSKITYEV